MFSAGDREQWPDQHARLLGGRLLPRRAAGQRARSLDPGGGDERGQGGARELLLPLSSPRLPKEDCGEELPAAEQGDTRAQVEGGGEK